MIFFPRELCERLEKLGCKSESGYWWIKNYDGTWRTKPEYRSLLRVYSPASKGFYVPAYYQNDFTGCSEQARENAKIRWGYHYVCRFSGKEPDHCGCCDDYCQAQPAFGFHRHAMIDAPDAAKYLEETIK